MPTHYLVITLGAQKYPDAKFTSSPAFEKSNNRFKEYASSTLKVRFKGEEANGLDLFDSDKGADDQDLTIAEFLERRIAALKKEEQHDITLLLYYVGHGAYTGGDFYFAIKRTRHKNPLISSLMGKSLADTIKDHAKAIKTYAFLDSCFSAEAAKLFLSAGGATHPQFVRRGISLLCSSSRDSVSYLLPDESATAFTDGLLAALTSGSTHAGESLTLRDLFELTWDHMRRRQDQLEDELGPQIREKYDPGKPEIHSPQQRDGDLADEPIFPNLFKGYHSEPKIGPEKPDYFPANYQAGQHDQTVTAQVEAADVKRATDVPTIPFARQSNLGKIRANQDRSAAEVENRGIIPEQAAEERRRIDTARHEAEEAHTRALVPDLIRTWLEFTLENMLKEDEAAALKYKELVKKENAERTSRDSSWSYILDKRDQATQNDYSHHIQYDSEHKQARLKSQQAKLESDPKISAFPVRRSKLPLRSGKFLKTDMISVGFGRFW
jgi:hypothetical protein